MQFNFSNIKNSVSFQKYANGTNHEFPILDIAKILIIVFVSIALVANFKAFFLGADTLVYGIQAVNLANGSFGFTHELMQETGWSEFIPAQWVTTIHKTAIPTGGLGIYGLSTISYLIGGYYGLFYLGPIFTIALLIISERCATKFFGSVAGLVTLILLSSDMWLFFIGMQLLTGNIFSVFLILGCFSLIKFFHNNGGRYLLFASAFFATASFFRLNGIIFFPTELILVAGFFVFQTITQANKVQEAKNKTIFNKVSVFGKLAFSKMWSKKTLKIGTFILIPWLVFFLSFFSYNAYYFGDPFSDYTRGITKSNVLETDSTTIFSNPLSKIDNGRDLTRGFFNFDSTRFEKIKFYSVSLIPDTIKSSAKKVFSPDDSPLRDQSWFSVFSFFILISALSISLYKRINRTEIIVFIVFILGLLLFYSANSIGPGLERLAGEEPRDRYMIPNLILTLMIFGFIMERIWKTNLKRTSSTNSKLIHKSFKIGFVIVLIVFLAVSFYNSYEVQRILKHGPFFIEPSSFAERYPLEIAGISENSIIVDSRGRRTIEYNAIPFNPRTWSLEREWNTDLINQHSIEKLKILLEEGHDVVTWRTKKDTDTKYYNYLALEHSIVLKDYSATFCKLHLVKDGQNDETSKPDPDCYLPPDMVFVKIFQEGKAIKTSELKP